ncbi:hypothetical protein EZS27_007047 [termite gut metagenome]|uniref:Glycoside hydrolase family 2 n=1 Tax=termite gut metagenome TaxID=433724 RepID=A0A5J4SHJ0_9ZZZZ
MHHSTFFSPWKCIKSGLLLAGVLLTTGAYPFSADKKQAVNDDRLFSLFQQPPTTAKPFVRWWWNGDKITGEEILRELDVLKEAGIGGVEINPIAFPGGDDLAIPSLPWLSPEWIEMVKVALKGAEERGMTCDIIVGSGWPFGAEFLQGDERSQLMTLTSRKVQGAGTIEIEVAELLKEAAPNVNSHKDATSELYALCLAPVQMDKFTSPTWLSLDPSQSKVNIQVPAGEYILYALVKVTGFQAVINGAPGAAGPVLNHYNREAVLKFLNRMSDQLFPELKGMKSFRAMFCDSMELEGANWCPDFIAEFRRRRGYDITPYLPFILFKVGGMGHAIKGGEITNLSDDAKEEVSRARYDFVTTCMEIVRDRFLVTYTQWCNQHGFKSRMQAYGNEFHPLEASLNIDIPECETWIWGSDFIKRAAYTNVNKFVASAAHLSGKKLISCEELTSINTVFNSTLEHVKITGDQSNLSGVNHSILHGFSYSPPAAPFPGWVRYGTFINERNLWWSFFKQWTAYKTRVSALLQETEAFADIAVMHPLADMWTIHGPQRDPFPDLQYPSYQYSVWEGIHKNGNSCDYTSESIITKSTVENGYLKYNNRKYHTLILLEVETMLPETAKALSQFVSKGGKLIFVGKEPYKSPGLKNHQKSDKQVAQIISAMKKANPSRVFTVDPPANDVVAWFANIQQQCDIKPYMRIDRPDVRVSQIRHRAEGKDIFFIANSSQERVILHASFPESQGTPCLWNAETGERFHYPTVSGNTLTIDLPPAASQLIVFDTQGVGADMPVLPAETAGTELKDWTLRMEHINGTVRQRDIATLFDLSTDESTYSFAGALYYEKKLTGDTSAYHWLDLGKVHGVSEVTLDGESLGCHWYGRHLYRLRDNLSGKTLRIKITTTLGNYFKSTPENKVGYGWTHRQSRTPAGMLGPVKLL